MVDMMFKVKDQFESYMDEEALIPWKATKNVREGGYKAIDLVLLTMKMALQIATKKVNLKLVNVPKILLQQFILPALLI